MSADQIIGAVAIVSGVSLVGIALLRCLRPRPTVEKPVEHLKGRR